MFLFLLYCVESESLDFDFEANIPSDASNTESEPESEPDREQEELQNTEPSSDQPEEEEEEYEEIVPEVPKTDEYLSETATHMLVFEERHDASHAHLWNFPALSENGFFFTTMYSGFLMLREYDMDFNVLLEPIVVAKDEDLEVPHHSIADHATLRHGDKL